MFLTTGEVIFVIYESADGVITTNLELSRGLVPKIIYLVSEKYT